MVDATGDRLEVLDVEGVRVQAAVPADHVERVGRIGHPSADDAARTAAPMLDEHLDVGAFYEERIVGSVEVAFAVRRVLEKLTESGQVPLGRGDVRARLDDVEVSVPVGNPAVRRRPRDHHVVARSEWQFTEDRLDRALTCLLYTSDAADDLLCVDLGGRR